MGKKIGYPDFFITYQWAIHKKNTYIGHEYTFDK